MTRKASSLGFLVQPLRPSGQLAWEVLPGWCVALGRCAFPHTHLLCAVRVQMLPCAELDWVERASFMSVPSFPSLSHPQTSLLPVTLQWGLTMK